MGKLKQNDSDNEMDVEDQVNPHAMETQNVNKVVKKNKKITKSKSPVTLQSKNKAVKQVKSKDVAKHFAKIVNLKKNEKSLAEKQQIFKKIVKGLHGQKASKKQRKKSRIMLKKELHRALQKKQKPESRVEFSTMQSEKSIIQKKKKEPLNEKAEVIKMRSAMGQSLSSLKSMLAQKLN